jgi:hypothetical protein
LENIYKALNFTHNNYFHHQIIKEDIKEVEMNLLLFKMIKKYSKYSKLNKYLIQNIYSFLI